MPRLTLCLAYYENPGMLRRQLEHWSGFKPEALDGLSVTVVDDGSPVNPAAGQVPLDAAFPFNFALYRMLVDIPWNQDACRNLAVAQAETDWVLLTDMDHMVPQKVMARLLDRRLEPDVVYTFRRVSEPDMAAYKPHPNSWLMTRALYDKAGGYDERFAGVYGTDGMFRSRLRAAAGDIVQLKEALVRVPREVTPDASTTTLERKTTAMAEAKERVKNEIVASGNRWTVRGRFPWARIV